MSVLDVDAACRELNRLLDRFSKTGEMAPLLEAVAALNSLRRLHGKDPAALKEYLPRLRAASNAIRQQLSAAKKRLAHEYWRLALLRSVVGSATVACRDALVEACSVDGEEKQDLVPGKVAAVRETRIRLPRLGTSEREGLVRLLTQSRLLDRVSTLSPALLVKAVAQGGIDDQLLRNMSALWEQGSTFRITTRLPAKARRDTATWKVIASSALSEGERADDPLEDLEVPDELQLLARELQDDADNYARTHSEGWFYDDETEEDLESDERDFPDESEDRS